MPYKPKITTRGISTTTVTADTIPKNAAMTNNELDSNFLNIRDASIGVASDDSTVIDIGLGNTLKVAGGTGISTAVSGQTLTITGTAQAQGITFVGDDSSGTTIPDGNTIKLVGQGGTTVGVSNGVITITGGSVVTGGSLGNLTVIGNTLTAAITNDDITIAGNGTGSVFVNSNGKVLDDILIIGGVNRNSVIYGNDNASQDQFTVLRASGSAGYENSVMLDSYSSDIFLYTQDAGDFVNLVTPAGTGSNSNGLNLSVGISTGARINFYRNIQGGDIHIATAGAGRIILGEIGHGVATISTLITNQDIKIETNGTGTLDLAVPTSATIGANGAASAPTANPVGYLKIKVNGTTYQLPYYNI